MKIALCLSGYFNSIKDSSSCGDDGFLYIKKHILDEINNGHEVDVFFHNWQPNNFKYDCVIKTRFDLGRINRNTSKIYPCQCINFDTTLDMSYFYQVYWDLFNEGPADMWFYSNSENMDNFCNFYDKVLKEYLPVGSDYHKYPSHMVVNGILLHKWFLMDCKLWYNSIALESKWE